MGLLDIIKEDIEAITSDTDGFAKQATFIAPDASVATVNCLHTKHHLGYSVEEARDINFKNAHVAVSEKFLTDLDYPVRNARGEVMLQGHKVQVADSTGTVCTYVIQQWMPDETIGLILIILADFKE